MGGLNGGREATRDFPFHDGRPVSPGWRGWGQVLIACALGFFALLALPTMLGPYLPHPEAARWIGIAAFACLPLVGLALAVGRRWTALFPPLRWKDVWIGLIFVPFTWGVSIAAALWIQSVTNTAANPAVGMLEAMNTPERIGFFASMVPQLFGEELVTILPFLALLALFRTALRLPRGLAIILAWLGSAAMFGALHLPTYDWNLLHVLVVIGSARLALTMPYLITKSPWSSTIAHVVNDWTLFGGILVLQALSAAVP